MWARAIIFGIELVGFIIFSIFAIIKFYKKDVLDEDIKKTKKEMRFNIIYFSINFLIILAIFLFTYTSYVFFSYNKLILITSFVILSVMFILTALTARKSVQNVFGVLTFIAFMAFSIILGFMVGGELDIDNTVVISKQTKMQTITSPTMFTENQVGFVTDNEGNTKTYVFYYKDNDIWNYKELKVSETKIIRIQDKNTYIEETVTKTQYCKKEKKPSAKDYNYVEEKVKHTLYLNLRQRVEIKKTD